MNRILDESKFVRDQREIVLAAIRSVDPQFQPKYTFPEILYDNHLVNHLDSISASSRYESVKFSPEEIGNMLNEQLDTELKGSVTIKSIFNGPANMDTQITAKQQQIESIFADWRVCIAKSFKRHLNSLHNQSMRQGSKLLNVYQYLRTLSIDRFVDILINEIEYLLTNNTTYSPPTTELYSVLGSKVMLCHQIEMRVRNGTIDKMRRIHGEYCNKILNDRDGTLQNARQIWQCAEHNGLYDGGPSLDVNDQSWPYPVRHAVGQFLYNILLTDLKIVNEAESKTTNPIMMPIFYTSMRNRDGVNREEVIIHPLSSK